MRALQPLKNVRNAYIEKKYQTTSSILKTLEKNTTIPPKDRSDDTITMQLIGHSTYLINMYWTWIITDPVFSKKVWFEFIGRKFGSKRRTRATLSIADIPKLDYVLLSHAHLDHRDNASLLMITHRFPHTVTFICPKNTKNLLRWVPRVKNVISLDWDEEVAFWTTTNTGDMTTTATLQKSHTQATSSYNTHGTHTSHTTHEADSSHKSDRTGNKYTISFRAHETKHRGTRYFFTKITTAYTRWSRRLRWYNSYLISHRGKHIFFAGDTAYTEVFHSVPKPVDVALMPIGWFRAHHCSPEEARQMAAEQLQAKRFLPMHFETFHSSKQPIYRLYEVSKKQQNTTPMQVWLLSIGEIFTLPE